MKRILFATILLAGCATPHVVDIVQPNDKLLNCPALQNEVDELQAFIDAAENEKGVNWSNAGRAIVSQLASGRHMKTLIKQLMRQISVNYICVA
mgnify:CR=1 FL=1